MKLLKPHTWNPSEIDWRRPGGYNCSDKPADLEEIYLPPPKLHIPSCLGASAKSSQVYKKPPMIPRLHSHLDKLATFSIPSWSLTRLPAFTLSNTSAAPSALPHKLYYCTGYERKGGCPPVHVRFYSDIWNKKGSAWAGSCVRESSSEK